MTSEAYIFPASFAQQRLWFLDQFEPGQSVYNMAYAVRVESPIDAEALAKSLDQIVQRHESLRTTLTNVNGEPMQTVARQLHIPLEQKDLTSVDKSLREERALEMVETDAAAPFDIAQGPLLRVRLLKLDDAIYILTFVMHHIISDGWSMGVFMRELAVLYDSFVKGEPHSLPELQIQYADYATWQREWLQGEALTQQLQYWTSHLEGAPAALELASDRTRPAQQTFNGARLYSELPAPLVARLRALSRQEGVTLFMTLLAAFDVLLWKFSGQPDIVVGTPIAGRTRPELEMVIGYFANTLPLRVDLTGNPRFNELLKRVREVALGAYANQDLPFDRLVEELQPDRSLSHTPLFQVVFGFENTPNSSPFRGLKTHWLNIDRGSARTDLSLFATDEGAAISCMWEFSSDLFDRETIQRMITSFKTLLENIAQNPTAQIGYLQIWSEDEQRELLEKWNGSWTTPASMPTVHEQFQAQVVSSPAAVAVICGHSRLTFEELNVRANQLAHHLQRCGVGVEVPVGVYLERSPEIIVALLAILKAGGAYVPLDPAYPADRLAFMLEDARVTVLLTDSRLLDKLPSHTARTICLDDWATFGTESKANPQSTVSAENLAYTIYTSGSTGRPKGVQVTHQTVTHLFSATQKRLDFRAGDIWTVVHSFAFDFSVWEIWGCLLQGGSLVIVPLETVQSPADLFELLCLEHVTVLNQTPSALRELLAARERARLGKRDWSVRVIVCGGDALDQELAIELGTLEIPVWNFYGPTESTVWTTFARISPISNSSEVDHTGIPTIGRPIEDLQIYLLDQYLQPVPAGVAGELLIGGAGLARGYLRRPELTAEKFISDKFSKQPGTRLYRSGDLARHRSNGNIEFMGRMDTQVKLRGFRVELGEIESALAEHPDVAQAVVVIREDYARDRRLVGYIVPRVSVPPGDTELRRHLLTTLPDYMVPSIFVTLKEMPLTQNKKVDRRALPAPERSEEPADGLIGPRTPMEELLAEIWSQVLHVTPIGIYDNFFELGGHSLLATQVTSRIRQTLQIDLPVRALFECLTIAAMANRLDQMVQGDGGLRVPPIMTVAKEGKLPLSFAQQRLWFLDQLEPGNPFYNIGRALHLSGQLDIAALTSAINHLVRRHESLRTCFGADEGTPFQQIINYAALSLPIVDVRTTSPADRSAEVHKLAAEEVRKPFDLSHGPLLRATLFRLQDDEHVLVLTMHHIAADEWSLAILFRELSRLYEAFTNGRPSPLSALPIQYADYAAWQRQSLQGEILEKLVSYWRKQLDGVPTILEIPTDRPRPGLQSFRGAYEEFLMPRALLDQLKELSRKEGVTLFMTCLAAYDLLLARLTGKNDLLIGTDVANRGRIETESLIGFFTNLLPLRVRIAGDLDFEGLLRQVRETTLEAYAHQDLPFEKLVEELRPQRDLGRNPMVQVLLVMQNPDVAIELSELKVSHFDLPLESSRFDLVLFLSEGAEGLAGFWLYNPDLFDASTISRLSDNYEKLLSQAVAQPSQQLDAFEIVIDRPAIKAAGAKDMDKQELRQSRVNRLRNVRRRGVDLAQASSVSSKLLDPKQNLPLLIEPAGVDIDLAEWAAANRPLIEEKLLHHGALLFRGFALDSVPEFERFASSICTELFGEYGDLPREELGGKVYGSTPYPSDERILFHNESSHMHQWPMLIWFYCVQPPSQGGESPILDCRRVYRELDPRIREKFETKGLMYVRNFTDGLDVSWQDFFHTTDRAVVEAYCRKAKIDFEWKENNGLRTRQVGPAVVRHPQTGEPVFFNQLQLHHIACLTPAVRQSLTSMMRDEDLPRNVYYGDGSTIEDAVIKEVGDLYENLQVKFPWQKHDVLMLNNMLVSHSRNPYMGERKIVVALGSLINKKEVE